MRIAFEDAHTGGRLVLTQNEPTLMQSYQQGQVEGLLAIAWNRGEAQTLEVDGGPVESPAYGVVTLMNNQAYRFEQADQVVLWQFNREFYCILDHDVEVSCAGFLFYGTHGLMTIAPDAEEQIKLQALLHVFVDELQTRDRVQGEMLRMLLKRLIIKLTRLAREQHLSRGTDTSSYDLIRQFAVLVETHYRTHHQVQEYAELLNRSPKTLSNLFAQAHNRSPLQVIQDRIALEAQRLLRYTDKSVKEIGYELGFEAASHFSRFFKRHTEATPTAFRAVTQGENRKI